MTEAIEHLPNKDFGVALQHLIVHYHHRVHLEKLVAEAGEEMQRHLRRAWRCQPYGVLVEWNGPGAATAYRACQLTRTCPWCLGRSVMDLHDRIETGPWAEPLGKQLLLGRLVINDHDLNQAQIDESLEARIRFVRQSIARRLRRFMVALGVDGGIVTFQVGPRRYQQSRWSGTAMVLGDDVNGYEYTVTVLGEVNQRLDRLAIARERGLNDPRLKLPKIFADDLPLSPEVTCRHGGLQNCLRHLLVGTSKGYSGEPVTGAFTIPAWPLAKYAQWNEYIVATRGLPLFTTFGTWKQGLRM